MSVELHGKFYTWINLPKCNKAQIRNEIKKNLVWVHDLKQSITSPEFKEQIEKVIDVTSDQFFCWNVYSMFYLVW